MGRELPQVSGKCQPWSGPNCGVCSLPLLGGVRGGLIGAPSDSLAERPAFVQRAARILPAEFLIRDDLPARRRQHLEVKNLLPASKCLARGPWSLFNRLDDTRSAAQPEPERGREPGICLCRRTGR